MPRLPCPGSAHIFNLFAGEGKQCDMTGLFDSRGYHTLVFRAGTGLAARTDLPLFRDVLSEQVRLFVIDRQGLVRAKLTKLWFGKEAAFTALLLLTIEGSSIFSHLLLQFMVQ
jgi:hypothetical protein